jgi:ribose 5-phosphate isomerase A
MTQDELKKAVGWAALQYVQPGTIVGVGTGSTAAHFIDALGTMKGQIEGAVSSSDASTEKLKSLGITVFDLNEVDRLGIYVDGADEINGHMQMIKGGTEEQREGNPHQRPGGSLFHGHAVRATTPL